jgi:hypothetical protein
MKWMNGAHADESNCQMTDITTDNQITGKTVTYVQNTDGNKLVTMDIISAITPDSCGYNTFSFVVLGQDVAIQASTVGITVDNDASPKTMTINTNYKPGTYQMWWYAIPSGNQCQTPILKAWTLQLNCPLTSVTVATNTITDTYSTNVAGDDVDSRLLIAFPTYT